MIALLERLDTVKTPDRVVADDLGLLRSSTRPGRTAYAGTRQRRGPPHRLSDAVLPPDCDVWHGLRVPDTLIRRRAGPVLIHIRHPES